jgi:hypothetical protein
VFLQALKWQITVEAMKHTDEKVALQGIEFWSNVCEEELDIEIAQSEVSSWNELTWILAPHFQGDFPDALRLSRGRHQRASATITARARFPSLSPFFLSFLQSRCVINSSHTRPHLLRTWLFVFVF